MPKRWYTRLILEDKQDTVQIFYARKLQILDRIVPYMTTLCVIETFPLKFNCDGVLTDKMPKRWYTRRILEDKQDTGPIFYGRRLQILNCIGTHIPTLCVRPCFETWVVKGTGGLFLGC